MNELSLKWGPYLADRQWGVVREDYSATGDAWDYTTHDDARSKAWRWGEEGIGGFSDDNQFLCLAPAFWNGRDPILKERFFGLGNSEGNHGEDVKELYYYLDAAPDHRYLRMLYKYPQAEFPYGWLLDENRRRSRKDGEFEIKETGIFNDNRYFDIFIEYALGEHENDVLLKITAENRGPDEAWLAVLPTIWFRNLWAFGLSKKAKPQLKLDGERLKIQHPELSDKPFFLVADGSPDWLFCENETNFRRLHQFENFAPSAKDGIHEFVVHGHRHALNPQLTGTKAAAFFQKQIPGGGSATFRLRLSDFEFENAFADFDFIFEKRKAETNTFFQNLQKNTLGPELRAVQRQAWAGLVWSKQLYFYQIPRWLAGDPGQPAPPAQRRWGRNADWPHFEAAHVLSMPDKWEYPWFAAWDLAFHCVAFARIDPGFAKDQLRVLFSEKFLRDDGNIPAYEWNFSDVNPPVQAWAAWRVFEIEQTSGGVGDLDFLESLYPKFRLAYDWWFAQKDADGNDLFSGGFLGLDNIGVFDRSKGLPGDSTLEQADATAWAGFYSLQMLRIALKLAQNLPKHAEFFQNEAFGFFEHFLKIAFAIGSPDDERTLWDDTDGFFYDNLRLSDGTHFSLNVRSVVGLVPMFSVLVLDDGELDGLPIFKEKAEAFLAANPDLASMISRWHEVQGDKRLLSMLRGHRLKCLLRRVLDAREFLSDFGLRSLSRWHLDNPFTLDWLGQNLQVRYLPGESDSGMFGGNSNWRGPIWMPVNFLLIESLREFHAYFSDDFQVECPVGSGQMLNLNEVADFLSARLLKLFQRGPDGKRPLHGGSRRYGSDPFFKDLLLFYEYFDGDTGRGCGASHQTGWTALAANLV